MASATGTTQAANQKKAPATTMRRSKPSAKMPTKNETNEPMTADVRSDVSPKARGASSRVA